MEGFTFSQAINTSEITVNEAGNTSRRGRLLFNDSLAPVEWSFSTYARPHLSSSLSPNTVHAVEEALWAMFVGVGMYDGSDNEAASDDLAILQEAVAQAQIAVTNATLAKTDADSALAAASIAAEAAVQKVAAPLQRCTLQAN